MKIVIHMLLTLTLIGVISGGLLSRINNWASPKIAEHRRAETEKAIYIVQSVSFRLYTSNRFRLRNL